MDFGLIALSLFLASKILDYVAPRTKTTIDDKVRAVVYFILPLLPAAKETRAKAAAPAPTMPAPEPPKALSGFRVTDHR